MGAKNTSMEKFSLTRWAIGDPVVTRSGRPVEQLAFFNVKGRILVYGVVNDSVVKWFEDGNYYESGTQHAFDLFHPTTEE